MESSHLIKDLRSSQLTTLIFSHGFYLTEAIAILKQLSKKGIIFVDSNISHLQSFCLLPYKETVNYSINYTAFQRPFQNRIIQNFSFYGLTDNMYLGKEYVRACLGFEGVWFGNRGFQLLTKDNEVVNRGNLETLEMVLKKTKKLTLNRLERTYEVLNFINKYPENFQNIVSISIEYHKQYAKTIEQVYKLRNIRSLELIQPYQLGNESKHFMNSAIEIIKGIGYLRKLVLMPMNEFDMVLFFDICYQELQNLEELDTSVFSINEQLIYIINLLKSFKDLRSLAIHSKFALNLHMFQELTQVKSLTIPNVIDNIPGQDIQVYDLSNLTQLTLNGVGALIQEELMLRLAQAPQLRQLEIAQIDPVHLHDFLRDNISTQKLKITKFKSASLDFMEGLFYNYTLKHLEVQMLKSQSVILKVNVNRFKGCDNNVLGSFTLKGSTTKDFTFFNSYFSSLLGMMKNLRSIELCNINIIEPQFELFAQALIESKKLLSISIDSCKIDEQCLRELFRLMAQDGMNNLKVLQLNKALDKRPNLIPDLMNFLTINRSLQRLDIEFAHIDFEQDFQNFMEVVSVHPQMKFINIDHGKVDYKRTNETLQKFAEIVVKTCGKLKHFKISSTTISSDQQENITEQKKQILEDLCKALPNMYDLKF